MKRLGAAKGTGSGYRNLRRFPKDSSIHAQSARGMKQPQRVPFMQSDYALPKYKLEKIGRSEGLHGYYLERYLRFMKMRLPNEAHSSYAAEWAERFAKGMEYRYSDEPGRKILRRIDTPKLATKLGSVFWQNEMLARIDSKIERGEKLDDYEMAFIQVQAEHNLREMKKLSYPQLKRRGINLPPKGDADRDGVPNAKDCKPLDPKKHSLTDLAIVGGAGYLIGRHYARKRHRK